MGKKVKKIAHITSVHNRYDARIFLKECVSLTKLEYTVYLIVADGYGNEVNSNVSIIDIGKRDRNRYLRMVRTTLKMYKKVKKLKPVICHFHDPELMPIGLLLKINKIKVIYDVHEDIPKQILRKHWIKRKYKKQMLRDVEQIIKEARGMDEIDFELKKEMLRSKLQNALNVDFLIGAKKRKKNERQFIAAMFLLFPGSIEIYDNIISRDHTQ